MVEVTNELIYEVLKKLQGSIAEMQTGQAEAKVRLDKIDGRLNKMDGHMEMLAAAIVNLEAANKKQGNQIEILAMAFQRQNGRLERIETRLDGVETRLDRVDQRLGLDQTTN